MILTTGAVPDTHLAEAFIATGRTVHLIGDCHTIGFIEGATSSALNAALAVG